MRTIILKLYVWYYLRKAVVLDKLQQKAKEIR